MKGRTHFSIDTTRETLLLIRFLSASTFILGLVGFLVLSLETARAQPGSKITNPFVNSKNKVPPGTKTIQVNPKGAGKAKDVPDPKVTAKGIEVGGGPPGGVKQTTKVAPLSVDSETGIGSNAVITDFNYPDADILDIARTIGKLTGKNFIFDKNVKGRISIVSNAPITVGDAWRAFLTALDINGYTLIPSGEYIRLARQRDARDKQLNTYIGKYSPNSDALITRVFPLKHINASEVARTFRSFMPANSRIIPYEQTNTVIVTDTGSNIQKLEKMLDFLDIEGFDAGIEVIRVNYASAVELAKLIETLLPGTTTGSKSKSRRRSKSSFTPRRTKEGGIINNIIADERTNSLIVHANEKGAVEVKGLVKKLDQKLPAVQGGGKIHVVYLQFADAEEISKTLNALGQRAPTSSRRRSRTGSGSNPTQSALFEGAIKVSADKSTNSLVVTASPSDFVTVQRVISKLDIPRDEVYCEVVIMEMTLGKDFKFSSNLALPTSAITFAPSDDLIQFLTNPAAQRGLALGFQRGETVKVKSGTGSEIEIKEVTGLIKALQTNNLANVIATPQILTLDNVEAKFETNERIPVPTSNVSQTGTTTTITKENVGLSLSLKPQINKVSNFVKLEIKAKLEDITPRELPAQVADVAFATLERKAETSLVVADSDTVVLGGLVRDKRAETVSKIPILGDIPLLGWLFSSRSEEAVKTNLLIFITPHIIRRYEKMRAILDDKLRERDEFVERNAGGEDPLRPYRDEMIRKLPDIKKLIEESKNTSVSSKFVEPTQDEQGNSPLSGDQGEVDEEKNRQEEEEE